MVIQANFYVPQPIIWLYYSYIQVDLMVIQAKFYVPQPIKWIDQYFITLTYSSKSYGKTSQVFYVPQLIIWFYYSYIQVDIMFIQAKFYVPQPIIWIDQYFITLTFK